MTRASCVTSPRRNVAVPVNAKGEGYGRRSAPHRSGDCHTESGTEIFKNGAVSGRVPGVTFDHVEGNSPQSFVVFAVGSGTYQFAGNAQ